MCRRPAGSPVPSATKRPEAISTAIPIGRLMKKTHRQVRNWVITPPSSAPEAPPAAATRAPDAERPGPRAPLGVGGDEDGQGGRGEHRAAEPLEGAGDDQHGLRVRDPVEQAGEREEREPGQEQAPAAEEIGGAPAEEEESGEGQRIGVDHPLQAARREAEVVADRRQGDVDHRDVEDDHELAEADEQQHQPGRRGEPRPDRAGDPWSRCRSPSVHSSRSWALCRGKVRCGSYHGSSMTVKLPAASEAAPPRPQPAAPRERRTRPSSPPRPSPGGDRGPRGPRRPDADGHRPPSRLGGRVPVRLARACRSASRR